MKVRWTSGSVRFRITPTELEMLRQNQAVSVELSILDGIWTATIDPSADTTGINLAGGSLTMSLRSEDVTRLCKPETEGVYFKTEGEPSIRYFVEKDFPCIHPRPQEAQEPGTETFVSPPGFETRPKSSKP